MILILVTLLWYLSCAEGQIAATPDPDSAGRGGNFKYFKPDSTAACILPYFVHITISVPKGVGNVTLVSMFYGQADGAFTTYPVWRNGVNLNPPPVGTTVENIYKYTYNPQGAPTANRGVMADANNIPFSDMLEFTLKDVTAELYSIATTLSSWSPWQIYVPFWIRNMGMWIWDPTVTGVVPAGATVLSAAITSTPPCLFQGAVSADGKTLRLWFVHCVNSIFLGNFPFNPANAPPQNFPRNVPGIFLFDMLTIHIPYPWLAPNPCFPEVVVAMTVTFYKWIGVVQPVAAGPINNAYLVTGPVPVDVPFVTTAYEMFTSGLVVVAIYPGTPTVAAQTVQGQQLNVITVIFVPGAQLQGGNTVSITVSIGSLTIFTTPWDVASNVIFADPTTANLANAYLAIGPAGTCAAFPSSVNCCAQSLGTILVPWPSYMSYPAWWISLVIKLAPPGCVLPAGKVVAFAITVNYLGKNPAVGVTIALQRNPRPIAAGQPGAGGFISDRSLVTFWQILSMLATSAEPQGVFPVGQLELWPLAFQPTLAGNWEASRPTVLMSFFSTVVVGGFGNWVVGTSNVLSVRFAINNNVAGTQPTALTVSITLNKGVAAFSAANTFTWFQFTTFPLIFKPNVNSVATPGTVSGSSPAACNTNKFVGFTSPLSTLFVTSQDPACVASWVANAVVTFVIGQDMLLVNGAAGQTVFLYFRIIPSETPGSNNALVFPPGTPASQLLDPVMGGGVVPIGATATNYANLDPANYADSASIMFLPQYTLVADCRNLPYQPSGVSDLSTASPAARCELVNAISYISPSPTGFLTCNEGATTATAQNLVTFVKYSEGWWTPSMWPGMNDAQRGTWPQQVNLPGTVPLYIFGWGYMFSIPMFAVVVTYPATKTNLNSLGVSPSVSSSWILAFIVKLDRLTAACSVNTVQENPWAFCATVSVNVVQVLHFPSAPIVTGGVPLNQYSPFYGWSKSSTSVCAIVRTDGVVAGWYTTTLSPVPGGSDAAWYAFFAFFALPLLCLLCCLAWALWYFRKPKACCPPCVPEYPVQEMYWVNAQPACPAPVYMVEPAVTAPVTCPPTTPIYLVQ